MATTEAPVRLPAGPKGEGYWKTLRSYTDQARFYAAAKEVGYIPMACGHRKVVFLYRERLCYIIFPGETCGGGACNTTAYLHAVDAAAITWKQSKAVAPIAQRFGVVVRTKVTRCADWEIGGTMQGTLRAPRVRVVIG